MTNTPSIDIKNLSGQTVATAVVTEQAILHEELMAADYVQLSWNSDTGTTLPAGAYITVDGERYSLLEPYTPTRANEAEYQYAPQFQSRIMGWQKHPVPLYTYEEDGSTVKTREFDWDFTGSPADAMHMVQQAILGETGEEWTVQLADGLPATISLSSQSSSIYAVLTDIAGQCDTEWWGDKATNTLYLAQCKHGTPVALTVGGNVGVPDVTAGKDGYFTRFYVFGSSRNVTQDSGAAATNSTVNRRLTLDPATYPGGYIDTKAGLQQGEIFTTTLYFDDIYPSAKLSISDVRARLKYRLDSNTSDKIQSGTDDEGNPIYEQYAIWYFRIEGFDFDPSTIIPQKNLSAHFETGQLGGRDFELTYHAEDDNHSYTDDAAPFQVHAGDYEIMLDESEGTTIPGLAYIIPQDGDQVILYNIKMPAEYTASARQELAETAQAEIARRTADNNSYEMDSYPHTFATDGTDLTLGQAVAYTNGGTALSTRVLMVEKHLDFPAQQRIRVGNAIIKGNTQQLKEEVTQASQNIDILAAFNELSASLSNAYAKAQREMIEGFAAIKNMWKFDPDDPTVIYSDYSAYVNGYISAKGNNPESGSTVSGASALVDLSDVDISNPQDGQIFAWDAARQKWVNADAPSAGLDEAALAEYLTANHYAKTTDIPSLEGYATQTWASGQFALKTVAINAGTGLTGGGNLSASRTLSLATVGTAGTYTKVTVDAYGRVTGHGSLAAGDIPALAISKITGLQDALDAKMDASQLSNLYRKRTDNVVTVSKALSALVAENDSEDAWNVPANTVLMLSNSNNALAFHLGGTQNERAANIQAGHNSSSYATAAGVLYLNRFGGTVVVGNPAENPATLNVSGGLYASSYIQVGSARLRYDSANNALYVQKSDGTQCGFYATGFVSTKGANGDAGSAVAGVTELSELEDVTISSPVNGQALVYRNGAWKNEAIETGLTSVSWDDVTGKPTWIGSTKPTYTAAEVGALTQAAADGRYVRQNLGTIGNNEDWNDYAQSGLYVVSASDVSSINNFPTESAYGYGTLVSLMFAEGRGVQWYIPDYSHPMAIRQAWTADEWQGWTYLLTHRNYSAYTVTKTGGGASGTWGIGITGNAGSATKLQTARTIALSGAVSGSATFDGSAGVTLSTTFNAQFLLTSLKTVDGSGCGLDADMLDGYEATDFYRKKVANAVSVSKALSDLVAENGSADAWNSPSNSSLFLTNNNNALSFYVGGTQNERAANIQAGHNSSSYATALGTLYLNKLGGNVMVGEPSAVAKFNVEGGIYATSYLQVGSARLRWDSATGALYVQKSDGTQCGFYATGFVSAKGANDDGGDTEATVLTIADERNTVIYPDTYAGRGIRGLFRANATDGLDDGGTYHTVLHIRQWANSSGGLSHQLAFTDNGGVWHRTALSETAWGEWSELSALSGLGDVAISSPTDGQALIYRDGVWKNETVNYGITMDVDWDDVKNKPAWIGSTKPSYSFSEITGTPSVTVSSSSSTNLSVSVEGSGRTVPSLYATYLGGTTKQGLFTGLTYSSNKLSVTIGGTTKSVTINAGGGSSLANVSDDSSGIVVKATSGTIVSIVGQSKPFYIDSQSGQTVGLRFEGKAETGVGVNMEAFKPLSAAAGNLYLGTSAARWRTIYSVNSLNTSSDLRLKDVRAAIPLTVAQVAAAPSFLYRWKKGADTALHAGSSAQYWQQALPQAVTEGADGYLAMEYDRIALAAAITVARAVTDHETRIRRLEQQLDKTPASTP